MPLHIRTYQPGDEHAIATLTAQWGHSSGAEQTKARIDAIYAAGHAEIFMAESDSQVVGWCYIFRHLSLGADAFADCGGLVVDEKHRRKGIATALMQAAIQWAQQQGLSSMRIRTADTRVEANLFYPSLGFVLSKRQNIYKRQL